MKKTFFYSIRFAIVLVIAISLIACSTSKKANNSYLLIKNSIDCDDKKIDSDELWSYLKQKPNRKILYLFRFHKSVYMLASKWKDKKISYWMKNTVGEPPVYLDTNLTLKTKEQFALYLASKGYFDAAIHSKTKYYKHRKKAKVSYFITANQPYTFNKINFDIDDFHLKRYVIADSANTLLHSGSNFDMDVLDKERSRIDNKLKNSGFYYFSKEYINYSADSSIGNKKINVQLSISPVSKRVPNFKDSVITENHKIYNVDSILVFPNFSAQDFNSKDFDTIIYQPFKRDTSYKYYFIAPKNYKNKIKPKIIAQSIFYKPGDVFNQDDVSNTYRRLNDLKVFRFSNIRFEEQKETDIYEGYLTSVVQLTRSPINSFNAELEGTNSSGDLGIAGNLGYQNKNTFGGAEILSLRFNGALEVQHIIGIDDEEKIIPTLPFNTIETGVSLGLEIPKFLLPVRTESFAKRNIPKTSIITGFSLQHRPDYKRTISNITFGYSWNESNTKKHILNPFEFSSVKIDPDSTFVLKLNQVSDKRILTSYQNHLTTSASYSYILSNQGESGKGNFFYFRLNVESAGSLNQLKNNIIKADKTDEGNYTLFNIRYFQYLRTDLDFRYYIKNNPYSNIATRFLLGMGYAYGNSDVLPFEKSFYAGGANGIRAWRIRSLGPGSYSDDNFFDKTGDFHLESNIEHRFKIYKFLHGASFVDVGNIWLLKHSIEYPGGTFYFNRFIADMAIGAGLGARFDFSFFIFRIDAAAPIRDPKQAMNQRWINDKVSLKDINFNIGIGYPF